MPYSFDAIKVGACRVIFNSVDLGLTKDGVQVDVKATTKRTDVDHFGVVETVEVMLKREASIKFNLLETNVATLTNLSWGMPNSPVTANGLSGLNVFIDSGHLLTNVRAQLRLHPVEMSDSSQDIMFPNAIWNGNFTFASRSDDMRVFTVEFFAYGTGGDPLFCYGI